MKIIIQATKNEKRALVIILIAMFIIIYYLNKKYFYVIDAVFDGDSPESITVKNGFIIPVKTFIPLANGKEIKVRLYGYKLKTVKTDNGFNLLLNSKKVYSIYSDSYYTDTKKIPTGRVSI